ncbi:putative methyl-CpG DNA binding, DNA-binding domain superfamily [Helianthus annuus]|nr:putative methyl-CpG DNA binding, DNA-binding domain superfamily [Helianthus annuus]KAJ0626450.1 putative methyl-CpG DNA binding, DNA-binding domain superfamily [Helianthus annuus]
MRITTKFTLPEDWYVKKVPRKSGNTIDKYYYDPETGRQFRSLKDVERYLTEGFIPTTSRPKRPKYKEKMQDFEVAQDNDYHLITVTPRSFLSSSPFILPDGWTVKEVPRKTGRIDKVISIQNPIYLHYPYVFFFFLQYYYEPGTGHMFRSKPAVQKHLAQLEEDSLPLSVVLEELRENHLPLSKAFKLATPIKNNGSYDSCKKSISKHEQDPSLSNAPPNKINWVIPSTAGETWTAFVGDEAVPDFMKQQWGRRFILTINNSKYNEQVFGRGVDEDYGPTH